MIKQRGFTLTEVLVTLGIIGIVASLTLPQLIKNYQHKVLDSQFKKSVSMISQIILNMKNELSEDKLAKTCITYLTESDEYLLATKCNEAFDNNLVKLLGITNTNSKNRPFTYNIDRNNDFIRTYNNKQRATRPSLEGIGISVFKTKLLPDGSFLNMNIIEHEMYVATDINGKKGPNRLGHDIFVFNLDKNNDTLRALMKPKEISEEELKKNKYDAEFQKERDGYPCNLNSTQKANGIGCAWYALRDECPSNPKLKYFECLPK